MSTSQVRTSGVLDNSRESGESVDVDENPSTEGDEDYKDVCECGADDTVWHVLFECPLFVAQRTSLGIDDFVVDEERDAILRSFVESRDSIELLADYAKEVLLLRRSERMGGSLGD